MPDCVRGDGAGLTAAAGTTRSAISTPPRQRTQRVRQRLQGRLPAGLPAARQLASSPPVEESCNRGRFAGQPVVYVVHRDDSASFTLIGTDGRSIRRRPTTSPEACPRMPLSTPVQFPMPHLHLPEHDPADGCSGNSTPLRIPSRQRGHLRSIPTDRWLAFKLQPGRNPVKITAASKNHFVYVIAQDSATTANLSFSANTSNGKLTPLPGHDQSNNVPPPDSSPASRPRESSLMRQRAIWRDRWRSSAIIGYSIAANGVPSLIADGLLTGRHDDHMSGKYLYLKLRRWIDHGYIQFRGRSGSVQCCHQRTGRRSHASRHRCSEDGLAYTLLIPLLFESVYQLRLGNPVVRV
jgi:hypothetical protein